MFSRIFRINLFVSTKALVGILIGNSLNLDQFEGHGCVTLLRNAAIVLFMKFIPRISVF